jgi:hypothetical protein
MFLSLSQFHLITKGSVFRVAIIFVAAVVMHGPLETLSDVSLEANPLFQNVPNGSVS